MKLNLSAGNWVALGVPFSILGGVILGSGGLLLDQFGGVTAQMQAAEVARASGDVAKAAAIQAQLDAVMSQLSGLQAALYISGACMVLAWIFCWVCGGMKAIDMESSFVGLLGTALGTLGFSTLMLGLGSLGIVTLIIGGVIQLLGMLGSLAFSFMKQRGEGANNAGNTLNFGAINAGIALALFSASNTVVTVIGIFHLLGAAVTIGAGVMSWQELDASGADNTKAAV